MSCSWASSAKDPPYVTLLISGQIVGERGGTAFPFRFWRGNAVPLAYTMTATYNTSNIMKKCALNARYKL